MKLFGLESLKSRVHLESAGIKWEENIESGIQKKKLRVSELD
jgi:hypothetical protein